MSTGPNLARSTERITWNKLTGCRRTITVSECPKCTGEYLKQAQLPDIYFASMKNAEKQITINYIVRSVQPVERNLCDSGCVDLSIAAPVAVGRVTAADILAVPLCVPLGAPAY